MALRLILLCALSSLVCVAPAARRARTQEQPRAPTSQQTQQRGEDDPRAPAGWKRYRYRYGSGDAFSVVFPRLPEESTENPEMQGGKLVVHFLSAQSDRGLYFAACIEIHTDAGLKITPEARRLIYQDFWKNFSGGLVEGMERGGVKAEVTALDPKRILISGREGQEQEFLIKDMHGRYRAATGDTQVYIIVALSTAGWPSAELESFSDSFKIQSP